MSGDHGRVWALYGQVVPEGRLLAGCWMQALVGPVDAELPDRLPPVVGPPLLGSWDHYPTGEEQAAVLPPEARDDGGCPDDPDGLHHSGCGCPDVDPINPN